MPKTPSTTIDEAPNGQSPHPEHHRDDQEIWADEEDASITAIDHAFRRKDLARRRSLEQLDARLQALLRQAEGIRAEFMANPDPRRLSRRLLGWLRDVGKVLSESGDRRIHGLYPTDDLGMDREFAILLKPFFEFMFDVYWRVEVRGIENIPRGNKTMLVANHSGLFCWDAFMVKRALRKISPHRRPIRGLINPTYFKFPYIGSIMRSLGMVANYPENCRQLLEQEETVVAFPGGDAAVPHNLSEPYRVPRFENSGYIEQAMRQQAEIVPVAIIGAHESYPIIFRMDMVGKLFGFPMLPVTPFFPLAFPFLWLTPMPVKWIISFLPSMPTHIASRSDQFESATILQYEENVRTLIEDELAEILAEQNRHGLRH